MCLVFPSIFSPWNSKAKSGKVSLSLQESRFTPDRRLYIFSAGPYIKYVPVSIIVLHPSGQNLLNLSF